MQVINKVIVAVALVTAFFITGVKALCESLENYND